MNLARSPIIELLTLSCLKPHTLDARVPLGKRFAGSKVGVVWLGSRKSTLAVVAFDKKGQPTIEDIEDDKYEGRLKGADLTRAVSVWSASKAIKFVVVLLATDWGVELERYAFEGSNLEKMELLRNRATTSEVTGFEPHGELSYAVTLHPKVRQSLSFSMSTAYSRSVVQSFEAAKLNVVRLQISVASMIDYMVSHELDLNEPRDLLAFDRQGYSLVSFCRESGQLTRGSKKGQWLEPRFIQNDPVSLKTYVLTALREREDPKAPVLCSGHLEILDFLKGHLPDVDFVRALDSANAYPEIIAGCLD